MKLLILGANFGKAIYLLWQSHLPFMAKPFTFYGKAIYLLWHGIGSKGSPKHQHVRARFDSFGSKWRSKSMLEQQLI
jgi:hypothetical protein